MAFDGFRWFSMAFWKVLDGGGGLNKFLGPKNVFRKCKKSQSSGWWGGLNKFLGVKNDILKNMSQNDIFHEKWLKMNGPNRAQQMNGPNRAQMNPLEWAQQGPTNEWPQQGPTNEWPQQMNGPNRAQMNPKNL